MPQLRTIEIDFDIHKLIEAERKSFDELPYFALRRLLALPQAPSEPPHSVPEVRSGRPWTKDGVELPHGSLVELEYDRGKQIFEGKIVNGKWIVNGRTFDSPSGALSDLAVTKSGNATKLNGWLYCSVRLPGETEWKSLKGLRLQAQLRKLGP